MEKFEKMWETKKSRKKQQDRRQRSVGFGIFKHLSGLRELRRRAQWKQSSEMPNSKDKAERSHGTQSTNEKARNQENTMNGNGTRPSSMNDRMVHVCHPHDPILCYTRSLETFRGILTRSFSLVTTETNVWACWSIIHVGADATKMEASTVWKIWWKGKWKRAYFSNPY